MGQHRLQPLIGGGSNHHHLNNAAYVRKLLIWSLGIVVPFLVLFCIFPSSTSLYKPSYNRIIVSQLQVPTSRVRSGDVLEPKLFSDEDPTNDETLLSNANDHTSHDDDSTSTNVKTQKDATTPAENFGVDQADSVPKATTSETDPKETDTLHADEGDHLSSNTKKHSDVDNDKKKQSDGDDKEKQSDASLTKGKKQKDGDEGDHDSSIVKVKKQSDTEEPKVSSNIDALDLSSTRGDGDEPEINAFMIEKEQNGELKEEIQNKKKDGQLNAESETKKNKKKEKITEEMAEVELGEALSISGKQEEDQPNIAEIEIKKSTKKAKAKMHDTDENIAEPGLNVEDSIARKKKADRNDEGSSTARLSRKEKAFTSFLGKESGLEEDATSSEDEEDGFTQKRKKGKSFSKLGKSSDGGRSSAEDHVLFLKEADEEAFQLSEATNAHKKQSGREYLENADITMQPNYSPELDELDGGSEEAPFLGKRKGFRKNTKNADVENEYTIIHQKHGEDMESFESSPYKFATTSSSQEDDNEEFSPDSTRTFKRKKKIDNPREVDIEDLNLEIEDTSQFDEASVDDPIISEALPLKKSMSSEQCRYFKGRWTLDSNYPTYKESTCPWKSIDDEQRCKSTTKTSGWRWQPSECSMKRFRANAFLKLMRGKSVAFVGDKMVKSQLKSLVCLLAEVETPSLLYNDKFNQSMSWHFRSSNLTLSLIWSPYLVQQTSEDHYSKLQLDKLDTTWAKMVPILDVLVLGVGSQFAQPSLYKVTDDAVGCYSCQALSTYIDTTNFKEISLYSGFRAAMRSSIMGIGALPGYTGVVLFLQPFGFEENGSYYGVSLRMKDIQEDELKKAHSRGSISNQSRMEVLHTNFNSVSNYDPIKGLRSPTCLIPSPLADTWNQVLQHTLTRIFTLELDT